MADHVKALIETVPEAVSGGIILVLFLVVCYGLGRGVSAFQNARFTQAWGPLIAVIGGTVANDPNAAVSSQLRGTFQGRTVEAEMTPRRNRSAYQEDYRHFNEFEIRVLEVSGGKDWHVSCRSPLLGLGPRTWAIQADEPLRGKLEALGVIGTVERLGGMSLRYAAAQRALTCRLDVTPRWVPTADRFRDGLAVLVPLAEASEAANPT